MPMLTRRTLLRTAAAGAAFSAAPAFAQGNWPSQNVRMIVPYPAGGSTDVLFRILAEKLKDKFGQSFTVENRPGASGNIGIDQVVKSAPDGYTIGCATIGHFAINQYLIANMPFNAEKDLDPGGADLRTAERRGGRGEALPGDDDREFIAWAKARPKGISIGSPGPGTSPHLSGVLFEARTGVKRCTCRSRARRRPFRRCCRATSTSRSTISLRTSRRSSPATCARWPSPPAQRWPTMPNVPTMAEAGIKDFVVTSWSAYVLPAATPRAIVDRLSAAHKEFANDAALQKRFLDAGARLLFSTPEEARAFAAKEAKWWQEVVKIAGLKPQ